MLKESCEGIRKSFIGKIIYSFASCVYEVVILVADLVTHIAKVIFKAIYWLVDLILKFLEQILLFIVNFFKAIGQSIKNIF